MGHKLNPRRFGGFGMAIATRRQARSINAGRFGADSARINKCPEFGIPTGILRWGLYIHLVSRGDWRRASVGPSGECERRRTRTLLQKRSPNSRRLYCRHSRRSNSARLVARHFRALRGAHSGVLAMTVETNETKNATRGAPKKPPYDVTSARDADGNAIPLEDGRLTAVPLNWVAGMAALKRGHFHPPTGAVGKLLHWAAQAHCEDQKALAASGKADDYREKIESHGAPADPVKKSHRGIKSALKAIAVDPSTITADEALALLKRAANS